MRRSLPGMLLASLLITASCDEPDQIYEPLPDNYDPDLGNGLANVSQFYTGSKGYLDETLVYDPGIATTEVCADTEIAAKQSWMVSQPIVPMVGAGGLDMTGGADWSGLTIDEAQSPDMLCQALYFDAEGVAAWGDYYELIAFFDTQTRKIDDLLVRSGYKGTIQAGDFTFEINEAVDKAGTRLSRGDGSARDPRTDDNMVEMDQALITAFRPGLDASGIDCIDAGSCYIIMSGTLPVLVFMSVGAYVVLEPVQQHIVQMEISLKRPFRIGMGDTQVVGLDPTIYGTAAAGIPDCEVTFGTTWNEIESDCLGGDSLAMAQITATYGYEYMVAQFGGTLLYFERPGLANDEILPIEPTPEADDEVKIVSINAAYEGDFSMPFSEILTRFKTNLDAAIRAETGIDAMAPSGVEMLKTPDDPALPATVQDRYPDRLRPGGIYTAFCVEDGPDADTLYDSCLIDTSGKPVLPMVRTLQDLVNDAVGTAATAKLSDPSFYVQQFEIAFGEYFNGGPLDSDQINFTPNESRPDTIYATISLPSGTDRYTLGVYYGGNDDRVHFINWEHGATRMEEVLYMDAGLPTPYDPARDTFTMTHLMTSPRMGLGAVGTITWDETDLRPETRRALISIQMSGSTTVEVIAPFLESSSLSGYWVPLNGPHSQFMPADWFSLYGGTIGAGFYLAPDSIGSTQKEIVAITGSDFFGDVYFCGFPVKIGDYADDLLEQIEAGGYACDLIVRKSENREFITALIDMDSRMELFVTNNMIDQVFTWLR